MNFPAGTYLIGTLFLKTGVVLNLEAGATLKGSSNIEDYAKNVFHQRYINATYMDECLIFAEDAKDIGLVGQGMIDGSSPEYSIIPKK